MTENTGLKAEKAVALFRRQEPVEWRRCLLDAGFEHQSVTYSEMYFFKDVEEGLMEGAIADHPSTFLPTSPGTVLASKGRAIVLRLVIHLGCSSSQIVTSSEGRLEAKDITYGLTRRLKLVDEIYEPPFLLLGGRDFRVAKEFYDELLRPFLASDRNDSARKERERAQITSERAAIARKYTGD